MLPPTIYIFTKNEKKYIYVYSVIQKTKALRDDDGVERESWREENDDMCGIFASSSLFLLFSLLWTV